MATQQRFEGNTLAAVLAKVQKEIGPNATISSAQKVRAGGVGGFFAREKFEVMVTIPEPGETVAVAAPVAAPATSAAANDEDYDPISSLLGLAEKISKEDINEVHLDPNAPASPAPTAAPQSTFEAVEPNNNNNYSKVETTAPHVEAETVKPQAAPKVVAAETEQAKMETATPEVLTPDEPQISTETDSFAEVLSRVAFQAHMTEEQEHAQQQAAADRQRRRIEDEIPGRPAFLDAKIVEPEPTPQPEPVITPQPEPQPEPAAAATFEAVEPNNNNNSSKVETTEVATTPSQSLETTSRNLPEVVAPSTRTRISDHPLAALGLPTEYIPVGVAMEGIQDALTSALERLLPRTPDIRPSKGSVIAIVGERFDAMEVAEELAEQFGRPAEEIILASQTYRGKGAANVLRTVRNAEDAQRSWSRRPRPTIVAIEANPGSRDASWAEHVLTALEPIATYGVADATRKSDDIKAWADSLGGIDCLAVNNIEETVSPAAVLATGIPVERVDGRRVSAAYWALMLTERLLAV